MALLGPLMENDHNIPKLPRSSGIKYVKFQKSLMTIKGHEVIPTVEKALKLAFKGVLRGLFFILEG